MERKTISAHEINKYSYCPYQWYYEKLYGRKELRRLYQERNEALSLQDGMTANFTKGLEYHSRNYRLLRLRSLVWKIGILLLIFAIVAGYFLFRSGASV
ncbi:hypothetical protein CLNEO_07820 [Anaerotignum neopropionicum]|uniref:PD-(D/E)XK nuclease superfamily protein n=1 Tax=Anaerotignum neopropionicum TaxID=36847 RepID=A0A136WG68_9FIRM|nr:hypothetical protein [Anaerotignum neopropionicum]KXL53556.1 hypothetical protein CLNEO_07820 [Anaerotignum neopropionicum]